MKNILMSKIAWIQVIGLFIDILAVVVGSLDPHTAVYVGMAIQVLTVVLRRFSSTPATLTAPIKLEDVKV